MLKKVLVTVFIATLFIGCATKPLITPQREQDPAFHHELLSGKKLAVWIVDSLKISGNKSWENQSVKQYRYYLKRVLPEKISQQLNFAKVVFQYQLDNGKAVKWTNMTIAQQPHSLALKVPVEGTHLDFPGGDYDFVLLIGSIDVQRIPKKLTEQVADIIEVAQNDPVQHSLRYAIWDNQKGKIAEKGIAVVQTIDLEKYLGTQRWEKLMADFAAEIFATSTNNQ